MKPVDVLQVKLEEYELALLKSKTLYKVNSISEKQHREHEKNLIPKIDAYRYAIRILNEHT